MLVHGNVASRESVRSMFGLWKISRVRCLLNPLGTFLCLCDLLGRQHTDGVAKFLAKSSTLNPKP